MYSDGYPLFASIRDGLVPLISGRVAITVDTGHTPNATGEEYPDDEHKSEVVSGKFCKSR